MPDRNQNPKKPTTYCYYDTTECKVIQSVVFALVALAVTQLIF